MRLWEASEHFIRCFMISSLCSMTCNLEEELILQDLGL